MAAQNDYSLGPVPKSERKGFIALSLVMLGLTFFSASMWTGGTLGTGLSYDDFFYAVLLGNLILGVYTAFLGYIGAKTGLSTHLLARYSFGTKGSYLPSLLLGGTQVGWFGVGVAMFALPVQKALFGETGVELDINAIIVVAGLLMTGTVYFGISALMVLSFIAVPAITILGGYSVYLAVNDLGGIAEMQKIVPAVDQKIDFNTALALVIGSFISAGTLTADFVRFGRKPKAAVAITLIAFFIGNSLMFIFGAAGAAATGFADISDVMMTQGLLIPAIIVLGLNIWTTNDNALYASGLGFSSITGIDSKKLAMINGVIGTVFALWLYNNFVGWLSFLSTAIPPIGGVLIADYFLIHRGQYIEFAKSEFETIRWQALIAVAVGIAAGQLLPGVVPVNAVIGGAVAYFISCKVMGSKSINTTTKKSEA